MSQLAPRLNGNRDQHHLVELGAQLLTVLAQQVQRHVVRTGNVQRLELGRAAHVEDPAGVVGGEPGAQAGRVQAGRVG